MGLYERTKEILVSTYYNYLINPRVDNCNSWQ